MKNCSTRNSILRFFFLILLYTITVCIVCYPWKVHLEGDLFASENGSLIAERIKEFYESHLFELQPRFQRHFALRLYRVSGEKKYMHTIAFAFLLRKDEFIQQVGNLDSPGYVEEVSKEMLSRRKDQTERQFKRKKMFKKHREFLFYTRFLYTVYQIKDYDMHRGQLSSYYRKALSCLSNVNFESFILDADVIKLYAPHLVNYVYWLKELEIIDIEEEFKKTFVEVFMNNDDDNFSQIEYENKIYGLTHFIIASSNYYQNYVSAEKFDWILHYFEEHIKEILAHGNPDIVAEIGLCFKLCGKKNHPVVNLAKAYILEAFDPKLGYIPSKTDKDNLNILEHRNSVAYLLLFDFDKLYPGPNLSEYPHFDYLQNLEEG